MLFESSVYIDTPGYIRQSNCIVPLLERRMQRSHICFDDFGQDVVYCNGLQSHVRVIHTAAACSGCQVGNETPIRSPFHYHWTILRGPGAHQQHRSTIIDDALATSTHWGDQ